MKNFWYCLGITGNAGFLIFPSTHTNQYFWNIFIEHKRCQFHHHFTYEFFVRTSFFYLHATEKAAETRRSNKKCVCLTLMKLTTGLHTYSLKLTKDYKPERKFSLDEIDLKGNDVLDWKQLDHCSVASLGRHFKFEITKFEACYCDRGQSLKLWTYFRTYFQT